MPKAGMLRSESRETFVSHELRWQVQLFLTLAAAHSGLQQLGTCRVC